MLPVPPRSLALLTLLLGGPALAQPAGAALADSLFGVVMARQAERLADVRDVALAGDAFTIYARVGWEGGSPVVTQRFVTVPGFPTDFLDLVAGEFAFLAPEEEGAGEGGGGGADALADIRYRGTVSLGGERAHHIEGVFYEGGAPFDLALWLTADSLLLRQAVVSGTVDLEAGRRANLEVRVAWEAFRPAGPLLLPHRTRLTIDGLSAAFTKAERERLRATLDALLATMKAMPPDQRRDAEATATWQIRFLRDLYYGRPIALTFAVRDVRINGGLPPGLFDEADPAGGYH